VQASGQTYPNRRGTVLVVEDEKDLVRLLKRLLPQAGYHVLAAMDGKEAIDLYRNHHAEIDAVLLDLGLPKVTGLDVIPKLKEQNPAVRIIIATGYLEPELKAELFRSGVMDCVHKPYSINDLLGKLEATIESSRAPVN
jgi:CheY-like chemotaxis protein